MSFGQSGGVPTWALANFQAAARRCGARLFLHTRRRLKTVDFLKQKVLVDISRMLCSLRRVLEPGKDETRHDT
jgi:hypothetical protein